MENSNCEKYCFFLRVNGKYYEFTGENYDKTYDKLIKFAKKIGMDDSEILMSIETIMR